MRVLKHFKGQIAKRQTNHNSSFTYNSFKLGEAHIHHQVIEQMNCGLFIQCKILHIFQQHRGVSEPTE